MRTPIRKPYEYDRYDVERWFNSVRLHRPVFTGGVVNETLGYGTIIVGNEVKIISPEQRIKGIRETNKHFFNELHRQVYRKSKKKIPRLVVIESGNGRFHTHHRIETPEHLSTEMFHNLIRHSWMRTKGGVEIHIQNQYDGIGLDEYTSKEQSHREVDFAEVDTQNSFHPDGRIRLLSQN
tara:strand:- start:626 stop:1165 length:540 start_codon:yes stop_codon:yes gene_type:complete